MSRHASRLPAMVDDMLFDAGHAGDAELRAALFALGSLASVPAPAPSGELAGLMADAGKDIPCGAPADELARGRRRRIQRPTALGLALMAGMATGIGGVAASSPVPGKAGSSSVQELLEDWSPSWRIPVQAARVFLQPDTSGVGPAAAAVDPGTDGSTFPAAGSAGEPSAPPEVTGVPGPHQQTSQGKAGESSGGRQGNPQPPGRDPAPAERPAADTPGGGQSRGDGVSGKEKLVGEGGLTEEAVPPLGEAFQSVKGAPPTTGRPAPGDSWLQKFKR